MTEYTVKNDAEMEYAGSNAEKVLTTTLWNQDGNIYVSINGTQTNLGVVYNKYCPYGYIADENGDLAPVMDSGVHQRTITGCTNTADASVVYYWIEQGYTFDFTATAGDYFDLFWGTEADLKNGKTDEKSTQYNLSETYNPDLDTLTITQLNDLLDNVELMQTIAAAYDRDNSAIADLTASKTDLGNFIAALNFFCGAKNHSGYGTSAQGGTWTSWFYDNDSPDNHLIYKALGFDSYRHITVDCGNTYYDTPLMYDAKTNEFTEVGHSILQENLDYGEVIRVGIPGHDIYMDGYKIENGITYYHLNYGWGNSSATKWYSESDLKNGNASLMDSTYGIKYVVIDLSPDINVVVSNTRTEYWGGSFKRGMERVNHIQTDRREDPVSFAFAEDIAGENIELEETAKITSKAAVDFEEINVNLYTSQVTMFDSKYSMSFDLNNGSISVLNSETYASAISGGSDSSTVLELDDSFIYVGSYSTGISGLVGLLDDYTFTDLTETFLETITGNAVYSTGSNNDSITLKGNSALLGSLNLGSGSDTLIVESGSVFYGGFSGDALTVNLTINNNDLGDMLILADEYSAKDFVEAAKTLNVSVTTDGLEDGNEYVLYNGAYSEDLKINLTIDSVGYGVLTKDANTITHGNFLLNYGSDKITLVYSIEPPSVEDPVIAETKGVMCDICNTVKGSVVVKAEFSPNATNKYYRIGEDGEWQTYNVETGVEVFRNATVYFNAENGKGWGEAKSITIDNLDNDGPDTGNFSIKADITELTNTDVTISGSFTSKDSDYDRTEYYINGKKIGEYTESTDIVLKQNATVEFKHYDHHGNESSNTFVVDYIDKVAPAAPEVVGNYTGAVQKLHIELGKIAEDADRVEYSFDGEVWNTYTDVFKFEENGMVHFRVVDKAGNISDKTSYEITNIDNAPPAVPVVSADITEKTNKDVTLTVVFDLNSGDVDKIQWRTADSDEWIDCGIITSETSKGVYTYKIKSKTNQTYYFRSIDKVGNISEVPYVVNNIDKTAPADPVYSVSEKALTNGDVLVEAYFDNTASDIKANEYSFNGSDWYKYEEGLIFEQNGKVYFRSVDSVGNISKVVEYSVTNIDKTDPAKAVIQSSSDGRITDKPIDVWADFGKRDVVLVEYSLNGEDWTEYDSGTTITAAAGKVYLRAYDKAGNVTQNAVVSANENGMIAEMPQWVWIDSMEHEAVQMQYTVNGEDWFDYDPETALFRVEYVEYSFDGANWTVCNGNIELPEDASNKIYLRGVSQSGIVTDVTDTVLDESNAIVQMPDFTWNTAVGSVVTLRAFDKLNRESFKVDLELDENGFAAGTPQWQWEHKDAVKLQYSSDKQNWYEYTVNEKFTFAENDKIYFRAIDAAGNCSAVSEFKIDNIDNIVDDQNRTRIYINNKYTAKNTFGKKIGGEQLIYGQNAFASISEVKEKYSSDEIQNDLYIVAGDLAGVDVADLADMTSFAAVQVVPQGSFDGEEYAYKTGGKAQKTLDFNGNDYRELELNWFKKVTLSNESVLKNVAGGDALVDSYQRYSKDGKTLTRQTVSNSTATGVFEASGNSQVEGAVTGYLNVELKNSSIGGNLEGGKDSLTKKSKTTTDDKKYDYAVSEKENAAASGKAEIKDCISIGQIENYKNVMLLKSNADSVSNHKFDILKSEVYSSNGDKFSRTITNTVKRSTDGELVVTDGSVSEITGYKSVILNGSQVGSIRRVAEDGSLYSTEKENWKLSTDATGKITGNLTRSVKYENGGSVSVAGLEALAGNIENFSNVTIGGTTVGNITNNVRQKDEKSYVYNWLNSEAYGEHDEYTVQLEDSAAEDILLKSTEKYAANGTLKVNNKALVGEVSGYNKVALDGDGEISSISAISQQLGLAVICGSYASAYADTVRTENGIRATGAFTESVTVAPAASVSVSGFTVKGDVEGYKSVNAVKAVIEGDVVMGNAFTMKENTKFTTVNGVVTKSYNESINHNVAGALKIADTTVNGDLCGYSKVELDKSVAGNISNNTAVSREYKYNELWDALEQPVSLDEFVNSPVDTANAILTGASEKRAANGSVALKNGAVAGIITGYNAVKLDGSNAKDKDSLIVEAIIADADDNAGEFGSYSWQFTDKINDQAGRSGKRTETVTMAPAESVSVNSYNVNGNIAGYKTVKLTDADVAGSVTLGENKTVKTVTLYSNDAAGRLSAEIDTVITYKQTGSFAAVDSVVNGDINGYNTVEVRNSQVGNIWHRNIIKEVNEQLWANDILITDESTFTEKLSGTVKLSERASVGNITNYSSVVFNNGSAAALSNISKVTVSGIYNTIGSFAGTAGKDSIVINKNSVLRVNGAVNFGDEAGDKLTVNGTLVLDAVDLNGIDTIAGKGEIAVGSALYADLQGAVGDKFAGTLLDLGNTVDGFGGSAFEAADNEEAGAVIWDGAEEYIGWLGLGEDISVVDAVDYIKLTAEKDSTLTISSDCWSADSGDIVRIGGKRVDISSGDITWDLTAGGEYIIEINRKDDNSMSYTMAVTIA